MFHCSPLASQSSRHPNNRKKTQRILSVGKQWHDRSISGESWTRATNPLRHIGHVITAGSGPSCHLRVDPARRWSSDVTTVRPHKLKNRIGTPQEWQRACYATSPFARRWWLFIIAAVEYPIRGDVISHNNNRRITEGHVPRSSNRSVNARVRKRYPFIVSNVLFSSSPGVDWKLMNRSLSRMKTPPISTHKRYNIFCAVSAGFFIENPVRRI